MKNDYEKEIPNFFLEGAQKFEDEADKQFWKIIKKLPNSKVSILDIGCGPGRDLVIADNFFENATLCGVDSSVDMCTLAKEKIPRADIRNESFINTSFSDKYFDIVLSRYAVQVHSNPNDVWGEVWRVMKKGGYGVFLITHPISNYEKKKESYFKQEIIEGLIFNKIKVNEPSHTFQDYLSESFFGKFELLEFQEGKQYSERKYPSYFIILFKKR